MSDSGGNGRPYTLIYDGKCSVCTRIVSEIAARDWRAAFEVLPSQAPGVAERFPWITQKAFAESLQLVRIADGQTMQGARAVEEILRLLPRGGPVAWLFRVPFVRGVAEVAYRWVARNRHRFSHSRHCKLPDSNAR